MVLLSAPQLRKYFDFLKSTSTRRAPFKRLFLYFFPQNMGAKIYKNKGKEKSSKTWRNGRNMRIFGAGTREYKIVSDVQTKLLRTFYR